MPSSIDDRVLDFYFALWKRLFSEPFSAQITDRRKRNGVIRQVEASAEAASQSLTRFFLNEQLSEADATEILGSFARLADLLDPVEVANPNVTPESVVEKLLSELPCPESTRQTGGEAVYRVALHSVVQVLMQIAPVMAQWQRVSFADTFELPRQVVNGLNQMAVQLDILGRSGQDAADERYEVQYRDYLMQRFHRVEAGTVRMTTNLNVDLQELFVMSNVRRQPLRDMRGEGEPDEAAAMMRLSEAREIFGDREASESTDHVADEKRDDTCTALEQVKQYPRNVIVGAPGVGKSTFLEWLQVKLASANEELILGDRQAIPLLLRVRQLDPPDLPQGAAIIERATASRDRAALMPDDWLDRQMAAGRVLLMIDGLDETEPELRDQYVLPWLVELCWRYPDCRYLLSSRPVGYPPGALRKLEFAECDLLDFRKPQIAEYTRHWCTAVRLARNEPADEARREGEADGQKIVKQFEGHRYIRNLGRNPLMLSAICLVNYFEGGQLPDDRALLYKLCVEGLLHHWDQRRGIRSEFGFEEKLRVCREVALAMQADDRAEYETDKVRAVFAEVLGDGDRATKLLEHIRYRTGLLVERRPEVFAFAHLTFQEYLAARAVHEGNRRGIEADSLPDEHDDGRWEEVIPLYCGVAPAPAAREMIERLIDQPNSGSLAVVLAEAYLAAGPELREDAELRQRVLTRIAVAPSGKRMGKVLDRFDPAEVAPIANLHVGTVEIPNDLSGAYGFLWNHEDLFDITNGTRRLKAWREMTPMQVTELVHLIHSYAREDALAEVAAWTEMYESCGPRFDPGYEYTCQAEIALIGLAKGSSRDRRKESSGAGAAMLASLHALVNHIQAQTPHTIGPNALLSFMGAVSD